MYLFYHTNINEILKLWSISHFFYIFFQYFDSIGEYYEEQRVRLRTLAPSAVAVATSSLRASVHPFYCIGISYATKKEASILIPLLIIQKD